MRRRKSRADCAKARHSSPKKPRDRSFSSHQQFTLTSHFAGATLSHAARPGKVPSLSGDFSMLDRRQDARDKVIYGGVAKVDDNGATRACVVRNISEKGA